MTTAFGTSIQVIFSHNKKFQNFLVFGQIPKGDHSFSSEIAFFQNSNLLHINEELCTRITYSRVRIKFDDCLHYLELLKSFKSEKSSKTS